MEKTLILVPNLGLQDFFRDIYLYYLDVVPSYHPMQFTGKLMNQTWENGKKPDFRSDFGSFSPNLGPKNIFCRFCLY